MNRAGQFVTKVVAVGARPENGRKLLNPTWQEVEDLLRRIPEGTFSRIDLFSSDESSAMTVYGESSAFSVVISVQESTYHYYWSGREPCGELREIAGHFFDAEKVCEDLDTILDIARQFWQDGRQLKSVRWVSEGGSKLGRS